jgi:hypothetical protein
MPRDGDAEYDQSKRLFDKFLAAIASEQSGVTIHAITYAMLIVLGQAVEVAEPHQRAVMLALVRGWADDIEAKTEQVDNINLNWETRH